MSSAGPPSESLFWKKGFLLLTRAPCNRMLPWMPILETETLLSNSQKYLVLSDELLPAHLIGLPHVTQNFPTLLLQLDPWIFPIPRTLQLFCSGGHLASAGLFLLSFCGSPVLLCGQMGHGSNSSAGSVEALLHSRWGTTSDYSLVKMT